MRAGGIGGGARLCVRVSSALSGMLPPAKRRKGAGSTAYAVRRGEEVRARLRARQAAEIARRHAVNTDRCERERDPHYQRQVARLLPPLPVPQHSSGQWPEGSPVRRLVAEARGDAQFERARNTVRRYGPLVAKAQEWMERQLAAIGQPFTWAAVVAKEGVLLLAYLKYLEKTVGGKQPAKAVAVASSAINNVLEHLTLARAANFAEHKRLRRVLRRRESPEPAKAEALHEDEVGACAVGWGYGMHMDGSACIQRVGADLVWWSAQRYRRWVALMVSLGFSTLGRFDDLSWLTQHALYWSHQGGVRVVSLCFTRRKQVQLATPEWVHIPDVPGDRHCTYQLLRYCCLVDLGMAVDTEAAQWPPVMQTPAEDDVRFLFPRFGQSLRVSPRPRFDPELLWDRRADADAYRGQLRWMLRECLQFTEATAARYGLGSMRCGGDTYLVRHGVVQAERMEIGHWATGSVEVGYHRLTALEYGKRRLLRGLTFAASTDR